MILRSAYELLELIARRKSDFLTSEEELSIFLKNEIYEYETKGADPLLLRTMLLAQKILTNCNNAKDTIERLANSLEPHGVEWTMLDKELSLERMKEIANYSVLNAKEMNEKVGTKIPAIPFGHKNSTWEWMMREYQEGDKFFSYSSDRITDDGKRSLRSGYSMVRGNKIKIVLTTMRS